MLLEGVARNHVPVTNSIGLIDIDEAVAEAVKVAAEVIRMIKIKVGVDPRRDIEFVGAVRHAVGSPWHSASTPIAAYLRRATRSGHSERWSAMIFSTSSNRLLA